MSKIFKSGGYDKFDLYMPNKPHFIHDEYMVSGRSQQNFHCSSTWASRETGRGFKMGVNNKAWRVSENGIRVDSGYIGKCDQT